MGILGSRYDLYDLVQAEQMVREHEHNSSHDHGEVAPARSASFGPSRSSSIISHSGDADSSGNGDSSRRRHSLFGRLRHSSGSDGGRSSSSSSGGSSGSSSSSSGGSSSSGRAITPMQCVELWERVAFFLDLPSLCSLAQVNRFFRALRWPVVNAAHLQHGITSEALECLISKRPQTMIIPWTTFGNMPPNSVLAACTPLRTLDLSGSRLNSAALKQLRHMLLLAQCRLVTLRLRDCDIGDAHCPQLVALLKENPSIQHLNLENNCLELLEDLLSSLGSTLPNLHALNLSDNPLSLGAAEALGRYLAGNPTLETLNLECCVLQSPAVAAVCNNLTSANTHLTLLDLSENDFDQEGVKSICAMLKCNRHLCELRLSHNSLAPQRPEDDRRLHRHRSHRRSSNSPLALLAEALRRNMTLQRLQLHECHICQGAVQPLAELLACNNTLRALGLKFNALGDGGAQCLGRQLLRNSGLQELDLRFCGLSCEGTAAVCEGLLAHTAIRVLRLDNNQIASDGLAALAQLVKTNASLRCLSLNYNSVSDWDAGLLALALRHNASLSELNLEGSASHLTGVGVRALLEAAHIHHSLRRLNVSRNDVSPAELPAEDTQQVQCFHRKLQPIHIRRTWLLFRKPVVAEGSIVFA